MKVFNGKKAWCPWNVPMSPKRPRFLENILGRFGDEDCNKFTKKVVRRLVAHNYFGVKQKIDDLTFQLLIGHIQ